MSGVGPPPPSPQPNGSRLRADSGWSLKSRAERRSSPTRRLAVVGVGGREVREHGRAVDADPAERVVLRRRVAVPRQLLREEARHARAAHELRQLAVVAEHVGVPEHGRPPAELAREEALAVAGTGARATRPRAGCSRARPSCRRRAASGPAATCARMRSHSSGARALIQAYCCACEQAKRYCGIALEQAQLRGEAAHALAVGLLERPQPGRVDVRVADRGDRVDMGAVAAREQPGEDRPGGRPAGAVVLAPRVAEPVEAGRQLARPGGVEIRARPSAPPARPGPARAPRPRRRTARARSARARRRAARAPAARAAGGAPPSRTSRCRRSRPPPRSARRRARARAGARPGAGTAGR